MLRAVASAELRLEHAKGSLMETRLVDTKDASAHLGLAESTLEKMRVAGHGPRYAKLGRAVRYRLCDLDGWAADHLVTSTSDETARSS